MPTKKQLITEINSMVKQLSLEDLLFIKQQTSMLIYNSTVDQMNQSNDKKTAKPRESNTKPVKQQGPMIKIDQSPNKMYIYISSAKNERVFFTVEEIAKMVDICQRAPEVKQIPSFLFKWLKKERNDFLNELNIDRALHPLMKELCITLLEKWAN